VPTHTLLKTLVQTLQSYKKIIDGLKNGFKKSQTYKKRTFLYRRTRKSKGESEGNGKK